MKEAMTFLGGSTFTVSPTHDWGSLFCKDCGAWPDEYAARIRCKGPSWRTLAERHRVSETPGTEAGPVTAREAARTPNGAGYTRQPEPSGAEAGPVTADLLAAAARFWARVDQNGADGCWPWTAYRDREGYGSFMIRYHNYKAHRVAYWLLVGPIPAGLQLDHLCRNPGCVNPAHLEAVTPLENTRRSRAVSAVNMTKTHCPKGHPLDGVQRGRGGREARFCRTCRIEGQRNRRAAARADTPSREGGGG